MPTRFIHSSTTSDVVLELEYLPGNLISIQTSSDLDLYSRLGPNVVELIAQRIFKSREYNTL